MMRILTVEPEKCTGCRICEVACSLHHEGKCIPSKSRVHVLKWEMSGVDFPLMCLQCEEMMCAKACPMNAISRDPATGATIIDYDLCIGCRMCTVACPIGGIFYDPDRGKAVVCDLCGGDPTCAKVCPTNAISYVTPTHAVLERKRRAIESFRTGQLTITV